MSRNQRAMSRNQRAMSRPPPPNNRKGPVQSNTANRRKLKGAKRVLFVGLNSKSFGLAETMAKQTGDDFSIYIYTDEVDSGLQKENIKGPANPNRNPSRRRASSKPMAARSAVKSQYMMGTHYLRCFQKTTKGSAAKRVNYLYSSQELRGIKALDYVFFATTTEYLKSNQGMNIKRTIATYSKQAVWIHLAFNPNLKALSTGYAEDDDRVRLLAVPLYTSFLPPAQRSTSNTLDTRYWYTGHPIWLQNPFLEEEHPKARLFTNIMKRNKLYVSGAPPMEAFVKKNERKQEEYLISLLMDGRKRSCILPLMLHLEFKLYLSKFFKNSKGGQGNAADSEREDERIATLVRESFSELKRQEQNMFLAFMDMSNNDFVQRLLTSLKRRYLSSRFDNKSSADIADAVSRINELRREMKLIVNTKPRSFTHCEQLVKETDVYARFRDVRIW